ncbi:MAG: 50S ribosomal protein L3 N(5)-glutamine methyltransferase [Gammaproteobacteria bacterium]|jgi:ribosomal protein L3 glutamine methyltransferase
MSHSIELGQAGNAGDLIRAAAALFEDAGLFYGHGTDNALDEAAALVFHVLELDHAAGPEIYEARPTAAQRERIAQLAEQRVSTREPLAYLTGEAWFAGLPFHVDRRVLIPRSPIAELIEARFEPWIDASRVQRILEIGTGSGCIAVALARAFPAARITATDISADALEVAAANARRHGVESRITLVQTDHADDISGAFDIIVSNPPYVPSMEMAELPDEYRHEPALGLVSGSDGLDSARRILQDAPRLMRPDAILVLEVGAQWHELEQAFPALPFTWLEFERGGIGVGLLHAADLTQVQ